MKQNYCISISFNNKPGFIIRVALILERRGHSIHSIHINEREADAYSEMILVGSGDPAKLDQIIKQISKLVDVISVEPAEEQISVSEEAATLVSLSNYAYNSIKTKAAVS
ncbi:MAG TPA: acetolactate synthase small subunit [Cytophagaceae bacterium]